jgi:hypothetical protein
VDTVSPKRRLRPRQGGSNPRIREVGQNTRVSRPNSVDTGEPNDRLRSKGAVKHEAIASHLCRAHPGLHILPVLMRTSFLCACLAPVP